MARSAWHRGRDIRAPQRVSAPLSLQSVRSRGHVGISSAFAADAITSNAIISRAATKKQRGQVCVGERLNGSNVSVGRKPPACTIKCHVCKTYTSNPTVISREERKRCSAALRVFTHRAAPAAVSVLEAFLVVYAGDPAHFARGHDSSRLLRGSPRCAAHTHARTRHAEGARGQESWAQPCLGRTAALIHEVNNRVNRAFTKSLTFSDFAKIVACDAQD